MDDDYVIIHSPLQQRVTRAGISVEMRTYHGEEDSSWILEVVDHLGVSAVWGDPFPTDRSALDEALSTIEAEGIASFVAAQGQTVH